MPIEEMKPYPKFEHDEPPEYKPQDERPPDLALLVSDGKRSKVLAYIGPGIEFWMDEIGESDVFDGVPAGIWMSKIRIDTYRCPDGDYDSDIHSVERALTPQEWEMFMEDHETGPWCPADWFVNPPSDLPKEGPSDIPKGWGVPSKETE
jgi:hypothetical protein